MYRKAALVFAMISLLAFDLAACTPANPADLSIDAVFGSGSVHQATAAAGTNLTIRVTFRRSNQGPKTNYPISVTDHLPQGLIFESGSGPGVECTAEGQDVTCLSFADLYDGYSKYFDLVISIDPRASGTLADTFQLVYAKDITPNNNSATVTITVTPLSLQTQELDFQKAKDAGAQFAVREVKNEKCEHLGVGDWLDENWNPGTWEHGRHPGVVFQVTGCHNQGEAYIEAFKSFRLKNGWVVKSFTEDDWFVGDVAFDIDIAPQAGHCSPLMQVHIRSYGVSTRGDPFPGIFGSDAKVGMQTFIEGPQGMDPYSGSPSVFCEPILSGT